MATTAEDVERVLVDEWERTVLLRRPIDLKVPETWTVEDVLDAFDQVMAARADRKVT